MTFKICREQPHFVTTVRDFALYATLRRALRSRSLFMRGGNEIIVLLPPVGTPAETYVPVAKDLLFAKARPDGARSDKTGYAVLKADTWENNRSRDGILEKLAGKDRLLLLADTEKDIAPEIRLAADAIVQIGPLAAKDLQSAFSIVLRQKISIEDAQLLIHYPLHLISTAARRGRPVADVLQRLTWASADYQVKKVRPALETPPLRNMFGYGPAKDWGLQLAQDLAAWKRGDITWEDMDRGIVLHGPPGVGKTIFAKALAVESGIPLVATSLGQWQSAGHLGDCLKKMRRSFADAKEHDASILFIDELDSLGDRQSFARDHRDYSTQVVNALLECLDGVEGREGVVIVGATNQIERVDPAILRSGRLDRAVEIPLPSADDRLGILEQGLSMTIPADDRAAIVMQTAGLSGADLAKAVRDAKRNARHEERPLLTQDVIGSLPALLPISEDYRRRNALHEAGHTIVGLVLGRGEFVQTHLATQVRADTGTSLGGQARFSFATLEWRDRHWYLDRIALVLGGIAAEKLVLGEMGDGAGGDADSDLAKATETATLLEVWHGMGGSLRWSNAKTRDEFEELRRQDVGLRRRIDRILSEQLNRAISILAERRDMLDAFTEHLFEKGMLTAEAAKEIMERSQRVDDVSHHRRTGRQTVRS